MGIRSDEDKDIADHKRTYGDGHSGGTLPGVRRF